MENLREICIIHTKEDKVLTIYFKEFLKFIGLIYFDYTYNEQNDSLNDVFVDGENEFDVILGINLSNDLKKRFRPYGKLYINAGEENDKGESIPVRSEEIWKDTNEKNVLDENLIEGVFGRIYKMLKPAMPEVCSHILKDLIHVYCEWDVLHLVFDNRYLPCSANCERKQRILHHERHLQQYYSWIKLIKTMEDMNSSYIAQGINSGREYLEYAIVYSMRKVNELCDILQVAKAFDTWKLLCRAQKIYELDDAFGTVESIQSKIARLESMYQLKALNFCRENVQKCRIDSCCSFSLYQLGKQYEICGYQERAVYSFFKSYRKNCLNFRSLFKIAVNQIKRKDSLGARKNLEKILEILQLNQEESTIKDNSRYLPPLELEYACKCYILLGNIEADNHGNYTNAAGYFRNALCIYEGIEENLIIKDIYSLEDFSYMITCLKSRLSQKSILKKLEFSQKINMYRDWRKEYERE